MYRFFHFIIAFICDKVEKNAVAIVYNYKEVGINNLAVMRWAKVQLGQKYALGLLSVGFWTGIHIKRMFREI